MVHLDLTRIMDGVPPCCNGGVGLLLMAASSLARGSIFRGPFVPFCFRCGETGLPTLPGREALSVSRTMIMTRLI